MYALEFFQETAEGDNCLQSHRWILVGDLSGQFGRCAFNSHACQVALTGIDCQGTLT